MCSIKKIKTMTHYIMQCRQLVSFDLGVYFYEIIMIVINVFLKWVIAV